jgi:hypothetical protein
MHDQPIDGFAAMVKARNDAMDRWIIWGDRGQAYGANAKQRNRAAQRARRRRKHGRR